MEASENTLPDFEKQPDSPQILETDPTTVPQPTNEESASENGVQAVRTNRRINRRTNGRTVRIARYDQPPTKALLFRDGEVFEIFWTTRFGEYEKETGLQRPM